MLAVVTPEFVVMRAWDQWKSAKLLVEKVNRFHVSSDTVRSNGHGEADQHRMSEN